MKRYICDCCDNFSMNEENIPTYKMFVCDNYDGTEVMICVECEKKIKAMWSK